MNIVVEAMEKGVAGSVFPGAVLLVSRGDDLLFHQAFGLADLATGEEISNNTLFDLASLTKPLATTMALLNLVQGGKLCLDQTIGNLLPGIEKTDKRGITVDSLLRHSSGLPAHRPYYLDLVGYPGEERRDRLRRLIIDEPLVYKPGTTELYSDLGFILLAWVVETISRTRLDLYVSNQIYLPLGLGSLCFRRSGDSLESGVAATENCPWRGRVMRGEVHDDNAWVVGGIEGHAGLFGRAFDVWTLLKEILHGLSGKKTKLIDKTLVKQFAMKKPGLERVAGFDTPSSKNSSSGRLFSASSLGHLGFTGTSFWMDPEKSIIVVLLTNRIHPLRNNEKIRKFRPMIHDLVMENLLRNG